MPVSGNLFRGLLVLVSVVLVTKLFLGKNTFDPPSSFKKERPSAGAKVNRQQHTHSVTNNRLLLHYMLCMYIARSKAWGHSTYVQWQTQGTCGWHIPVCRRGDEKSCSNTYQIAPDKFRLIVDMSISTNMSRNSRMIILDDQACHTCGQCRPNCHLWSTEAHGQGCGVPDPLCTVRWGLHWWNRKTLEDQD